MSVFGFNELGLKTSLKSFNATTLNTMRVAQTPDIYPVQNNPYHGYTDTEQDDTETDIVTHRVGTPNSWFGGNTAIASRPEGATSVGTVTALQNRGLYRDYDYDPETDVETESTTHWWDDDAGESITNEQADARISALSTRDGVSSIRELDENSDGVVDGYSWTQNVERTFWNFFGNSQDQTRTNTGGNRGANQDTSSQIVIYPTTQTNLGPRGNQQRPQAKQTTMSTPKKVATGVATVAGVGLIGKILYDNISNKF